MLLKNFSTFKHIHCNNNCTAETPLCLERLYKRTKKTLKEKFIGIAYDKQNGNKGAKSWNACKLEDLEKFIENTLPEGRTYYQFFHNEPVKGFLDIDDERDSKPEDLDAHVVDMAIRIESAIYDELENYFEKDILSNFSIRWMTSHGYKRKKGVLIYKVSLAGVYDFAFTSPGHQKVFMQNVLNHPRIIGEGDEDDLTPAIDMGVYSRLRCIRLLNCHKEGDDRVRIPSQHGDEVPPIRNFNDQILTLLGGLSTVPVEIPAPEVVAKPPMDEATLSAKCREIKELIEFLKDSNHTYPEWSTIGLIIYNETAGSEEGRALYHHYSALDNECMYNVDEVDRKWDGFAGYQPNGKPATIGSIHHFAKEKEPERYTAWKKAKRNDKLNGILEELNVNAIEEAEKEGGYIPPNNDFSQYELADFFKYANEEGRTLDDLKSFIKQTVAIDFSGGDEKYYTRCRDLEGFYWKLMRFTNIPKSWEKRKSCVLIKKNGKDTFVNLHFLVDTIMRDSITYKNAFFKPFNINTKFHPLEKEWFNEFNGLKPWITAKGLTLNIERIQHMLYHVHNVLCNGNKEASEYFLNLLAHLVQFPDIKIDKVIVSKGIEGAGKSAFFDFFGNYVIGERYYEAYDPQSNPLGKAFNSSLNNKIFITLNEAKEKGYDKMIETFKSMISEKKMQIEKKYHDAKSERSYLFWTLSLNNYFMPISRTDRRFFCIESSSECAKYERSSPYWTKFHNDQEEVGAHFYLYLMQRDLSHFDMNAIPMTPLRKQYMEDSTPAPVKFMQDLANNQYELSDLIKFSKGNPSKTKIHRDMLYGEFRDRYMPSIGLQFKDSVQKFTNVIKEEIKKQGYDPDDFYKTRIRIGENRKCGFDFDLDAYKKIFQTDSHADKYEGEKIDEESGDDVTVKLDEPARCVDEEDNIQQLNDLLKLHES